MRKSLGFKLFIVIMSIIILIGSIQLFVQSTLFSSYYEVVKQNKLEVQMQKYQELLDEDSQEIERFVFNELKSGRLIASTTFSFGNPKGFDLNSIVNVLEVKSNTGETFTVMSTLESLDKNFPIGSNLKVEGTLRSTSENIVDGMLYISDDQRIFYNGITVFSDVTIIEHTENNDIHYSEMEVETITIEGEVVSLDDSYNMNALYLKSVAQDFMFSTIQQIFPMDSGNIIEDSKDFSMDELNFQLMQKDIMEKMSSNQIIVSENLNNFVSTRPYDMNTMIIGVTTITPVEEVLSMLNKFYFLIFLGLLILSIVIAYTFSNWIKKPIIEMTEFAKDIANQNFKSSINSKRHDEIGELVDSLMLISMNLQEKIMTLEDANKQLKKEVAYQEKMKQQEKELVANVSHELKTPLTVMKGYIRGIQNGVYEKGDDDILLKLSLEVEDMTEMVTSLLSLFKLQTGQNSNKKEVFNIWDSILGSYDKLHMAFEEKNLSFVYDYSEEKFVKAEQQMIGQLFSNILVNAMKYSKPDTEIRLSITQFNNNIEISLSNECEIIDQSDVDHLWEPFYRVDKSRNKDTGGTGLGLSIVKEILESQNSSYSLMYQNGWFKIDFTFNVANSIC